MALHNFKINLIPIMYQAPSHRIPTQSSIAPQGRYYIHFTDDKTQSVNNLRLKKILKWLSLVRSSSLRLNSLSLTRP